MIKNNRAAGNQSLSTPANPLLTLPTGQGQLWAIPFTLRYDGVVTGDQPQYVISTGNFGAAGSLNIAFYTSGSTIGSLQGRIVVFADTVTATANAPIVAATKLTQGEHQYLVQCDGTTAYLYRCPIVAGVVATAANVVLEGSSTSPALIKELSGSVFMIGSRADGAANRRSDQSQSRTAVLRTNFTLDEVARMANGEDLLTDLKKVPAVYVRMATADDIIDVGPNKLPFTKTGSPTTSAEPAYNFTGGGTTPDPDPETEPEPEPQPEPQPGSTLSLNTLPVNRIVQRVIGSAAVAVAVSGAFAGTTPDSIEQRVLGANSVDVIQDWANTNATIGANTWQAAPQVQAGGMYHLIERSMKAGVELARTDVSSNRIGVGDIQAWIGSSGAERGFTSSSGTGLTPRDDVSYYDGVAWRPFGTDGGAIIAANALAEKSGVPFGMIDSGRGGSTLKDWLNLGYVGWTMFVADVADVGGFSSCVITVGSNDAATGLVQSREQHAANLRTLIQRVRDLAGNQQLWIVLVGYNRRTAYSTSVLSKAAFDAQSNMVRMAESDVGKDPFVIHVQTLDFLMLTSDGTHLSPSAAGYPALNVRSSFQSGSTIYDGVPMGSPYISGMTASGNDVLVRVTHRGSTDLNVPASATGFTGAGFDKQPITVLGVDRVNASLLRVRCDRPVETLQYLAGSAPAVGTPIYGSAAQPLPLLAETDMAVEPDTGVVPEPDTTAPVMAGTISITGITTSGATLAFQAATDNVGVAGYEYSINGGTSYVNAGLSRSFAVSALAAATTYQVRVRAYDAAGNRSEPLAKSFTTEANQPPAQDSFDASKVAPGRKVVFPGGTRVVVFGPNAAAVPGGPYQENSRWTINKHPLDEFYCVADVSFDVAESKAVAISVVAVVAGVTLLEEPVVQGTLIPVKIGGLSEAPGAENYCTLRITLANGEQLDRTIWFAKLQGVWAVSKDPDDKRYFVADVAHILADSNTQINAALAAIPVGVTVLEQPVAQGGLILVKAGGMDTSADPLNHCTLPFLCTNGEKFFRVIHFNRVDN